MNSRVFILLPAWNGNFKPAIFFITTMSCRAQQRMKRLHFNDKSHNYSIFFITITKFKRIVMTKSINSIFENVL